ncbi:MAG: hypothetical protein IPM29_28750 [Planctomycetes bacterium]|nr:hypothetical protein [Planctomycetota bacterium]
MIVAKGKQHEEHTLARLSADQRAALVLGPSGKLRAPTLLIGDTVVVGFHPAVYENLFGTDARP